MFFNKMEKDTKRFKGDTHTYVCVCVCVCVCVVCVHTRACISRKGDSKYQRPQVAEKQKD